MRVVWAGVLEIVARADRLGGWGVCAAGHI
jgi:hypothetical protein